MHHHHRDAISQAWHDSQPVHTDVGDMYRTVGLMMLFEEFPIIPKIFGGLLAIIAIIALYAFITRGIEVHKQATIQDQWCAANARTGDWRYDPRNASVVRTGNGNVFETAAQQHYSQVCGQYMYEHKPAGSAI